MKHLFTVGVWGAAYVERFLTYSLPSQLAAGNLPDIPGIRRGKYQIVTDPGNAATIRASEPFKRLEQIMPAEIRLRTDFFVEGSREDKYDDLSSLQKAAMLDAEGYDAVFFGYADMIWSRGSLANAARRIEEGYDAVFAPGLPVLESAFRRALDTAPAFWTGGEGAKILSLASGELAKVALDNLHSLALLNYATCKKISCSPAYLIWDVPGEGIVMRWFHLHPVALRTRVDNQPIVREFAGSLDEFFVPELFAGADNVYLARDSDEIAFCSIMNDFEAEAYHLPLTAASMAQWAENYAALVHREFFKSGFEFHHRRTDAALWNRVRADSACFAERLNERLLLPDSVLALMDPDAFRARRERQKRFGMWTRQEFPGHVVDEKESGGLIPAPVSLWTHPSARKSRTAGDFASRLLARVLARRIGRALARAVGAIPVVGGLARALKRALVRA